MLHSGIPPAPAMGYAAEVYLLLQLWGMLQRYTSCSSYGVCCRGIPPAPAMGYAAEVYLLLQLWGMLQRYTFCSSYGVCCRGIPPAPAMGYAAEVYLLLQLWGMLLELRSHIRWGSIFGHKIKSKITPIR